MLDGGGSSGISNLRTVRLLRVMRALRGLRGFKLIVGAQGKAASGSLNSYLRKKNQVAPTSPEEEIDRELEMEQMEEGAAAEEPGAEAGYSEEKEPKKEDKDG